MANDKMYLLRGTVRITEGDKRKTSRVVPFEGGICKGDSDEQVRASFKWFRTQKDRITAKNLEDDGRVELVSWEIIRALGLNQ
jgi:hypothetical protein